MIARRTAIGAAAEPHSALVRAARTSLDAPTPCPEWDVRALVNHMLYWAPVLAAAGRRTPPDLPPEDADLVTGDWPAAFDAASAELVAAWSEPAAWEGEVALVGPDPAPASLIGEMVLCELILHAWDLGRALGEPVSWSDDVLTTALTALQGMAPKGRAMGAFGPEVPCSPDAPLLDRVVALAGRDPSWTL